MLYFGYGKSYIVTTVTMSNFAQHPLNVVFSDRATGAGPMRHVFRIAIALAAFTTTLCGPVETSSAQTGFCAGYQDGYVEGYCYEQFGCLRPLAPLCPLARLGETTYQDGYNRGFIAGMNARRR